MIFDFFPNLLSNLISIVLPIHFTHKALRTSSPPYLAPWLMYWSIFSLFQLVESYTWPLSYLPLYSTIRFFFLTWLVLPQTQGATFLYQGYVEPFLIEYEGRIDNAIGDAHKRIKAAGGDLFVRAIDWVQATILGRQPARQQQVTPAAGENYTQSLLRRFSIPVAGFPTPGSSTAATAFSSNDLSSLLTSFTSTLGLTTPTSHSGTTTRDAQIRSLTSNATLVPPTLKSLNEKADFVAQQREKLRVLLGALDREALDLETQREVDRRVGSGPGGLSKSKSEVSFESVERPSSRDEDDSTGKNKPAVKGAWLGGWFAGAEKVVGAVSAEVQKHQEQSRGVSSGVDSNKPL